MSSRGFSLTWYQVLARKLSRAPPPRAGRIRTCAARAAGARYVIAGAVDKVHDRLRYTAQLFDGASGHELWSERYDDEGVDPRAPGHPHL